ncbi:gba-3, partial [Symbiodinium sp. KB8]
SCIYSADEERIFVRDHLGPALRRAGLADVKILIWDHNRDGMLERAAAVYDDPVASEFVWGMAYHWYGDARFETWPPRVEVPFQDRQQEGAVVKELKACAGFENVRRVADLQPEKHLLFTEGCQELGERPLATVLGDWKIAERYAMNIIADMNSGCEGWIDWNLVLNQEGGPNHVGNNCVAPVICDTSKDAVLYQPAFWLSGRSAVTERSGERSVLCLTEGVVSYFCKSERCAEITEAFNPSSYNLLKPDETMKAVLELLAANWEYLDGMPFHDALTVGSMIFTGLASGFLDYTQFNGVQPTPSRSEFKGVADQYFKHLKGQLSESESIDAEDALKSLLIDTLTDFTTDREHFVSTYTFKNLDPLEATQVRAAWTSGTAVPDEISSKLNLIPSPEQVAEAQGDVLEMVMRTLELCHGACILRGLSLMSGAGTDNLLNDQSTAKGRGKRAKGSNSRDTATSIDDNAKIMLQLRVESTEAKRLVARMATSAPSFTRARASAFLYQVFTASCSLLSTEGGQESWFLPDDDIYRDSMPLTRALTRVGFPSNGYNVNTGRYLLPITTGTADLVEPRLIKVVQVEAYNGVRVELQGALRYTKRITLISEGLQRASMQGALSVIDPGLLRAAANGINAYLQAPAAYTELPRLLATCLSLLTIRLGVAPLCFGVCSSCRCLGSRSSRAPAWPFLVRVLAFGFWSWSFPLRGSCSQFHADYEPWTSPGMSEL